MSNNRSHCNACSRPTVHAVLFQITEEDESEYEDGLTISWSTKYELLQCAGCMKVVLRRTLDGDVLDTPEIDYFPPAVSRKAPVWKWKIPMKLKSVLEEIY